MKDSSSNNEMNSKIGVLLAVQFSDGRDELFNIELTEHKLRYYYEKSMEMNTGGVLCHAHKELFKILSEEDELGYDFKGNDVLLLSVFEDVRINLNSENFEEFGCMIRVIENDPFETSIEFYDLKKWEYIVNIMTSMSFDDYLKTEEGSVVFENFNINQ